MVRMIDRLTDQNLRADLGRRIEGLTDEVFNVLRWSFLVGLTRFLSMQAPSPGFDLLYWGASGMLLGYLASRFLLRPEVPIFSQLDRRWKRIAQTIVNLGICFLAFAVVLWGVNELAVGVADYRFMLRAH